MKSLYLISDSHFKLDEKQIENLHKSAQNSNFTAIQKLLNYYYFVEQNNNKTANIYRKYKDINPKIEKALCRFLSEHGNIKQENECN